MQVLNSETREMLEREARENKEKLLTLEAARLERMQCPNTKCPLRHFYWAEEEKSIRTGLMLRQQETLIRSLLNPTRPMFNVGLQMETLLYS